MSSPWEKAVDIALTQSEAMAGLGGGVVAVSVGLLGFDHSLTRLELFVVLLAAGLSLTSSIFGLMFRSLIISHLHRATTGWGYVYRDALECSEARKTMLLQGATMMLALLALVGAGVLAAF